ncbi:hypothetical protein [Emcibacter sp.]|uniref:hypothetical protein n=1 Tax=Emcibacter sp. TaxID=1979954 RepID=UPI002AA879CD|nr:hypothetical protein [Emcibacter sp.]
MSFFRSMIILTVFALTGCSEPESIEEISSKILKVEQAGGALYITVKTRGYDGGASDLNSISYIVFNVLEWVMENRPEQQEYVDFSIIAGTVDPYGNESDMKVLSLSYPVTELQKVNWENFSALSIYNLAEPYSHHRIGREMVANYCSDETYQNFARAFCVRFLLQ